VCRYGAVNIAMRATTTYSQSQAIFRLLHISIPEAIGYTMGQAPPAAVVLDSAGRFVANVGVPAAIAFFILYQITPRLDQMTALGAQTNTQLAVIGASCSKPVIVQAP